MGPRSDFHFFVSDLTFPGEHLGNWNSKVAQWVSISNASHKQDLAYTSLASSFVKVRGQEHLKKKKDIILCDPQK